MVKICCYLFCKSSTRKDPEKKFFPFVKPSIDLARTKKWIELIGHSIDIEKITTDTYLCEDHFSKDLLNYNWRQNELLEPFKFEPSEEQKSSLLSSFRQLVNCLSPEEILDCVAMKIFETFSFLDLQTKKDSLNLKMNNNDLNLAHTPPLTHSPEPLAKKLCSKDTPKSSPLKRALFNCLQDRTAGDVKLDLLALHDCIDKSTMVNEEAFTCNILMQEPSEIQYKGEN